MEPVNIIYQSRTFKPEDVVSTYASFYTGEIKFYDVNIAGATVREWWRPTTPADDALRAQWEADALRTRWEAKGRMQVLVSGMTWQERKAKRGQKPAARVRRPR